MTCLAAQEQWLRKRHPHIVAAIDTLSMTFAEYHAKLVAQLPPVLLTGTVTGPLPPMHHDIRTADWHWDDQCPEVQT